MQEKGGKTERTDEYLEGASDGGDYGSSEIRSRDYGHLFVPLLHSLGHCLFSIQYNADQLQKKPKPKSWMRRVAVLKTVTRTKKMTKCGIERERCRDVHIDAERDQGRNGETSADPPR